MSKKILSGVIMLIAVILFIIYNPINKEEKDAINITENDKAIITEYLNHKTGNKIVPSDVECYSAFEILGTSSDNIYLWVLKENILGCGGSMPVSLSIKKEDDKLNIISFKIPGDGEECGEDIDKIFPKNARKKIRCDVHEQNDRVNRLQKQIDDIKSDNNKK